jgi:purine-cytosine permease-like protein
MSTTWYVGVIAAKIGDAGGDVGNELAFVFSLVVFIPARYLELKLVGR